MTDPKVPDVPDVPTSSGEIDGRPLAVDGRPLPPEPRGPGAPDQDEPVPNASPDDVAQDADAPAPDDVAPDNPGA